MAQDAAEDAAATVGLSQIDELTERFERAAAGVSDRAAWDDLRVRWPHSQDTPWAEIDRTIAELRPPDLVSWEMTVRYRGRGMPERAVSTTIPFLYNSPERSLTQEEVNERQLAFAAELQRRFGWKG